METLLQAGLNNALSATFLALVVACLGRVLERRPAVLHCLWFLVLLKLVTPPLYQVSIPYPEPLRAFETATRSRTVNCLERSIEADSEPVAIEESGEESHATIEAMVADLRIDNLDVPSGSEGPRPMIAIDWKRPIGMLWLTGTGVTLLLSCWRIRQFQVLLGEAKPAGEEIQNWVDELSADLGLSRGPCVWWVSGKLSPMLWALGGSPRLIIPFELWKSLDHDQRGTLLVHELAHLRRGDHHVRIFELVVTALYWWNPVLWWARRALRDVEEQCCDAWVVWAFPESAKSYAETLLETLDFLHQSDCVEPLLASGFGKVHHLKKRLTMIMNGNTPRSVSVWGALGALSLAVVLLPFNATWAQNADEPKEGDVIIVKTIDGPDVSAEELAAGKVSERQTVGKTITANSDSQVYVDVIAQVDASEPGKVRIRTERRGDEKTSDGKRPIHLELKTEGSVFVIEADSLKEAIGKLNEQVKALASKSSQSATDKQQKEALDKAVKTLADTAKHIDEAKGHSDKAKLVLERKTIALKQLAEKLQEEQRTLSRKKVEQDKKASAEDAARRVAVTIKALKTDQDKKERDEKAAGRGGVKLKELPDVRQVVVVTNKPDDAKRDDAKKAAERNSMRKTVEKLSMEVREKRVELAAAQKRLSELEREAAKSITINKKTAAAPVVGVVKPVEPTKHRIEVRVASDGKLAASTRGPNEKPPVSDQKRIDELEKRLQKLLDEVASLKKEKAGTKR